MHKTVLPIGLTTILALTACTTFKPQVSPTPPTVMDHRNMGHGTMAHPMNLGPADANVDLRFIDAMIPHHEGAVAMAKEALQKSHRPELKQLATAIIAAQAKEIAQMQQWRKSWYAKAAPTPMMWDAEMKQMMPMAASMTKAMRMALDLGAADKGFDRRFITAMISHHEGAIVMAKDLQTKTQRPELQQFAQAIITSQQAEIQQMQQWLKSW